MCSVLLQLLAPETTLWFVEFCICKSEVQISIGFNANNSCYKTEHKTKLLKSATNVPFRLKSFVALKRCASLKKIFNFHLLSADWPQLFRSLEADWIPQSDPSVFPRRKVDGDGTSRGNVHREPVAQLWDDTGLVTNSIIFCLLLHS